MKIVYHPRYEEVYASDPAARAGRMESVLKEVSSQFELVAPEPAFATDIELAHSSWHIAHIQRSPQTYEVALLAAGGAPMFILSAIVTILHPVLGLLASLYTLWLNVLAMQAAHRYSLSKALVSVLIPVLVVTALVTCCLFTLGEAVRDVFERIQDDIERGSLDSSVLPPSSLALRIDGLALIELMVDARTAAL